MVRGGWVFTVPALFALTACQPAKTPAEQARDDARDVAMVEAAQRQVPPPVPLDPEPISPGSIEAGQFETGCRFVTAGSANGDPILLANDRRALFKSEGRFIALSADGGSPALTPGLRTHYVGKAQSLVLERTGLSGNHAGEEAMRWPARATVRDAWDQLVYTATGELICGP